MKPDKIASQGAKSLCKHFELSQIQHMRNTVEKYRSNIPPERYAYTMELLNEAIELKINPA